MLACGNVNSDAVIIVACWLHLTGVYEAGGHMPCKAVSMMLTTVLNSAAMNALQHQFELKYQSLDITEKEIE